MTDTTPHDAPEDDPQADEAKVAPEEGSIFLPHPTPTEGEAPAP